MTTVTNALVLLWVVSLCLLVLALVAFDKPQKRPATRVKMEPCLPWDFGLRNASKGLE
jgi:hypothetical protein